MALEACEERYMTSQRSLVSKGFCLAKGRSCTRSIGNHLESSRLPKRAQASQEATGRSVVVVVVVVEMHLLLADRYEQRDLEERKRLVRLKHPLYGSALRDR